MPDLTIQASRTTPEILVDGNRIFELTFGVRYQVVRVRFGGPFGTVPELLFEKKQLIPALQQLLVDQIPESS